MQREMKKQQEEEKLKARKYEEFEVSKDEDPKTKEEKRLRDLEYQRKIEESRR